jgi:hypothetical protein
MAEEKVAKRWRKPEVENSSSRRWWSIYRFMQEAETHMRMHAHHGLHTHKRTHRPAHTHTKLLQPQGSLRNHVLSVYLNIHVRAHILWYANARQHDTAQQILTSLLVRARTDNAHARNPPPFPHTHTAYICAYAHLHGHIHAQLSEDDHRSLFEVVPSFVKVLYTHVVHWYWCVINEYDCSFMCVYSRCNILLYLLTPLLYECVLWSRSVGAALSYWCMRPYAPSVWLVYAALSY